MSYQHTSVKKLDKNGQLDESGGGETEGDKTVKNKISDVFNFFSIDNKITGFIVYMLVLGGAIFAGTCTLVNFIGIPVYESIWYWIGVVGIAVVYGVRVLQKNTSLEPIVDITKPVVYFSVAMLILNGAWVVYQPERKASVKTATELIKVYREESAVTKVKQVTKTWKPVYKKSFVGVGYTGGDNKEHNQGGLRVLHNGIDIVSNDRITVVDGDYEIWTSKGWEKYKKNHWFNINTIQRGKYTYFRNKKGESSTVVVERRVKT